MSKYIDADFLKAVLLKKAKQEMNMTTTPYSWSFAYVCIAESIDAIPSADVIPRMHGNWNTYPESEGFQCSICKNQNDLPILYCPNCHAKMDGKGNGK